MDIDHYAPAQKTDFDEIPIISLSGLDTEEGFERIAHVLVETAHRVGFFYLSDHGISTDVMDQAFAASRRFFDLPTNVKGQVTVNTHQRGWMQSGLAKLEGAATHDAKAHAAATKGKSDACEAFDLIWGHVLPLMV